MINAVHASELYVKKIKIQISFFRINNYIVTYH